MKASVFFFEKKKQKTFAHCSAQQPQNREKDGEAKKPTNPKTQNPTPRAHPNPANKVFLLLFVHKKKNPYFPTTAPKTRPTLSPAIVPSGLTTAAACGPAGA